MEFLGILSIFFSIYVGWIVLGGAAISARYPSNEDGFLNASIQGKQAHLRNSTNSSMEFPIQARNLVNPEPYFCGQIIGGHFMFGSASSYCGGYTVRDCSALCFYRNFTYFQCEGFVCHCFST